MFLPFLCVCVCVLWLCAWGYTQRHVDNFALDYFCWAVCGEGGGCTQTHVDNFALDYFCWAVCAQLVLNLQDSFEFRKVFHAGRHPARDVDIC